MQVVGLIGLGEKGYPFAQALQKRKIKILGFDLTDSNRLRAANHGIVTTSSISGVVMHLPKRKIILLVLEKSEQCQKVFDRLGDLLGAGDVIVFVGSDKVQLDSKYDKSLINNQIATLSAKIIEDKLEFSTLEKMSEAEKNALEACRFLT